MLHTMLALLVVVCFDGFAVHRSLPAGVNRLKIIPLCVIGQRLPSYTPLPVIAAYARWADWATDGKLQVRVADPRRYRALMNEYERQSQWLRWWQELQKPHLKLGNNNVEYLKKVPQEIPAD
jgi:hypothetical protein